MAGKGLGGSRRWFGLAVGALMMSGVFSLVLVVGRLPGLSSFVKDPLFARRCLVVHVNLALVVWLCAFLAALYMGIARVGERESRHVSLAWWLSLCGLCLFVCSGGVSGVRPVLSNYIPTLEHPLFFVGLGMFGLGLVVLILQRRLWSSGSGGVWPEGVSWGLRAAVVLFLLAILTLCGSWWTTPLGLDAASYYELLFWGVGHVLQVASVAGMLSVWLLLFFKLFGRLPLGLRGIQGLFLVLVLPSVAAPFWAFAGTTVSPYYPRFTWLMRWSIFPVVLVFLGFWLRGLWVEWRRGSVSGEVLRGPYLWGFLASAGLTVLGFVLGALIRSSTTLVPAHYHASIGGVTISYMTGAYVLLGVYGGVWKKRWHRVAVRWQPILFGVGQAVFAVGFGAAGLGRKTYGHEQHVRTWGEFVGLGAMGLGGLVAMVSGLLFLTVVVVGLGSLIRKRFGDKEDRDGERKQGRAGGGIREHAGGKGIQGYARGEGRYARAGASAPEAPG